jgi:hypothetical protein
MSTSTPLAPRRVNLLFLGGSNTMMKNGYAVELVKALGEYFEIGRVDNLAIGGSKIGMGLYTTLRLAPEPYDLIFSSYSITDFGFMKFKSKVEVWRWAFESLLGHLRQHSPQARVHNLLLGRRDKREDKTQRKLFAVSREISDQYGVKTINVDEYLHGLLPADASDKTLYEDASHYARPVVSALAGNYIARVVVGTEFRLQCAADTAPRTPIAPVPCRVHQSDHALFDGLGEAQLFKNSRHEIKAVALRLDESWKEITVPGSLMQLNYISTQNSARIVIDEDGEEPVAFDTLHRRADNGEFAFLIRCLLFSWKKPPSGDGRSRRVRMRVSADPATESAEYKFIKQFRVLPPRTPDKNNVVFLSGALYS